MESVSAVVNFVLEILQKLGLTSWPLVAIIFFILFRRPIAAWLPSIRRVGPGGVEAGPPPSQESQRPPAGETGRDPGRSAEELMRALDSPLLVEQENRILQDLRGRGLGEPSQDSMRVLLRYLAAYQIGYIFENAYQVIYGSQLALLQYLNTVPAAPVSAAQHYYAEAARRFPDLYRSYAFDSYLNFLASVGLVNRIGEQLSITPLGREFLAYLIRGGRDLNKLY